ncbi:hypothetical protein IAT38_000355 [Cryptococcus sp. DSM 104549]
MSHIHLSPLDHLRLLLSQLPTPCPCLPALPCFRPPPASPPLFPQEGELENLLAEPAYWDSNGDDNEGDTEMLRTPRGVNSHGMSRSGKYSYRREDPPSYEHSTLFPPSSSTPTFNRPRNPSRRSATSATTSTYTADVDADATPLPQSTLAHLPELAKRFEPALTLEDMEREEREQAERDRRAERAGGLDIYSPPVEAEGEGDEFGEFEQADVGQEVAAAGRGDDGDEGEEMAEVSFGLGDADEDESEDGDSTGARGAA